MEAEHIVLTFVLGSSKVKATLDASKLNLEICIGLRLAALGVLAGAGAERARGRRARRRDNDCSILVIVLVLDVVMIVIIN